MDKCLDPQLWHACAGGMVQMPPIGTNVFYFPQGHSEHASSNVDFRAFAKLPSMFLCRVSAVKYMADPDSDEVFAKIRLFPTNVYDLAAADAAFSGAVDDQDPPASFAKTLTQSDANNGGGFSVPRYCAETIFPRLDYTADPPVQTILAKDVHGQTWKFRHIYRGTPRRHLLTTGWSNFVNHKKLVAGDSIVFLRAENGELCVGVRRAKLGIGGCDPQFCWNNPAGGNFESTYGGGDDDRKRMQVGYGRMRGKVKAESVLEAVSLAASGKPFEIVYYPRAGTPEFCVRASVVSEAMRVQWCCGMRFKMPFETEDSSRISWFMGTISAAQVADPVRWPNSPWRLLQVAWDEPDLLQNVKRVSPWLVEVVSNMPSVHLTPFSPPRKKVRLPQHPDFPLLGQFPVLQHSEFPSVGHFPLPPLANNLLGTNSPSPAGIQGARHGQFGLSSSDLHFNKLQSGLFQVKFQQLSKAPGPDSRMSSSDFPSNKCQEIDGRYCSLTMGRNVPEKISNVVKAPMFVLFGQPILTEEQMSQSSSDDTIGNSSSEGNQEKVANVVSDASRFGSNRNGHMENSSDDGAPWLKDHSMTELKLETGHCNDASPPLGFSILSSYGDLHSKLTHMFSNGEGLEVLRTQLATNPLGTHHHDLSL